MIRRGLSDAQWQRIEKGLPGKNGDRGRSGADNRLFVDAVLWVLRTGSPWRDLPEEFGNWNSVFQRFRRWAKKGVWESLFNALYQFRLIDSCGGPDSQRESEQLYGGVMIRWRGRGHDGDSIAFELWRAGSAL